jgi:hypothetical protein
MTHHQYLHLLHQISQLHSDMKHDFIATFLGLAVIGFSFFMIAVLTND